MNKALGMLLLVLPTTALGLAIAPTVAAAVECQPFSGTDAWWWRVGGARDPVQQGATYTVSWSGFNCFQDGRHVSVACDASVSDLSTFRITWNEGGVRQVLGFYKAVVPIVATGSSLTPDHGWCDPDRVFVWTDMGSIRGRNARCDFSECGAI